MNVSSCAAFPAPVPTKSVAPEAAEAPAIQAAEAEHGPDLVVDRIIPSNGFPQPNSPVWFNVVVKNRGDEPAGAFDLRLTSTGLNQTARAKQGLAAGAEIAFRSMGPLYTGFAGSMEWVEANVDINNEVKEKREDNNYLITSISVQQPFPPGPPGPWPPPGPFPPHLN